MTPSPEIFERAKNILDEVMAHDEMCPFVPEPGQPQCDCLKIIAIALDEERSHALKECASEAIRKVSELTVNELVPFEQYEPFKRLAHVIAQSIRSLK